MEEDNQDNSITNIPIEPEQPLTPKPRKKLSKTTIIATLAIILGLAGIGFGVYGMFFKNPAPTTSESKSEPDPEPKSYEKLKSELNEIISVEPDEEKNPYPGGEEQVPYYSFPVVTNIKDKDCLGEFCEDKAFTTAGGVAHNVACGIITKVKEGGTALEITINYDENEFCYPEGKSGEETFAVDNFKSKISAVEVPTLGQAYRDETIFTLMEDGSVEYIPLFHAIKNNTVRSYGKIAGVEKVVRLILGGSCSASQGIYCGSTILAQRGDGKFYNIGQSVEFGPDTEKYYKH